ncbi:hypothetical protein MN116_003522 [Schistosoma mekongi]|uniref:NADH dehydrogenase [ubiquinone] 1 beta subcomplex subunit 7 n=1 Tax=Schistosoma mekongi TaxID=38744 RepID=A0AAE1ZFC5_SCHME|nr:hypothetical protein MN116_003522 [Schistosoma mekongi]
MGHVLATYKDPNSMPDIFKGPIFDQLDGFPEGRKRRSFILTEDEMIASGLRSHERDYCAHILVAFKKCRKEHLFPEFFCSDFKHKYSDCKRDDLVLRMKEYERERRLMRKRGITLNGTEQQEN